MKRVHPSIRWSVSPLSGSNLREFSNLCAYIKRQTCFHPSGEVKHSFQKFTVAHGFTSPRERMASA